VNPNTQPTWHMLKLFQRHQMLLASCILLLSLFSQPVHAVRVALVVGNSDYSERPLRNPVNDANLMQATLKELGFEVTLLRNADRRSLLNGLRDFEGKARDAEVSLFFFAGHGAQVGGSNYLIPVGGSIQSETDVPDEAVDASSVLRRLEEARSRVALVILDACRDNPFAGASRSSTRGLGRMNVPTGTIVAYATAPGSTAADGSGSNGVYTEQLVRQLKTPNLDIKDIFDRTAQEVERITSGKQRPREEVGLRGRFVLNSNPVLNNSVQIASIHPEPVGPSTAQVEQQAWTATQHANSVEGYKDYLMKYPNGSFSSAAKVALAQLNSIPVSNNRPTSTITVTTPIQVNPTPVSATNETADPFINAFNNLQKAIETKPLDWFKRKDGKEASERDRTDFVLSVQAKKAGISKNRRGVIYSLISALQTGNFNPNCQKGDGIDPDCGDYNRSFTFKPNFDLSLKLAQFAWEKNISSDRLAMHYQNGWGVEKDLLKAYDFFLADKEMSKIGKEYYWVNINSMMQNELILLGYNIKNDGDFGPASCDALSKVIGKTQCSKIASREQVIDFIKNKH